MTDTRPAYDFALVSARLSEAGMTLMALHVAGIGPAGYRSFWPAVEGAEADDRHPPAPRPRKITEMDEALGWIALIPADQTTLRKLVGARALSRPHPLSGHPVAIFSWRVLGERMGCSHVAAKTWWIGAVELIAARLNQPGLCQAAGFRGTRHGATGALRHARETLSKATRTVESA